MMQPSLSVLSVGILCCYGLFAEALPQNSNSVAFQAGLNVTRCAVPNTVALTFDDGPFKPTTTKILNLLDEADMRATFFVTGRNYANILDDETASIVRRMLREGHQIGSHTWSHPTDLRELKSEEIRSQMTRLDEAFFEIIGKVPRIMRAPHLKADTRVAAVMTELDYAMIDTDLYTYDWINDTEEERHRILTRWRELFTKGNRLILAHDTLRFTANVLVPRMINDIKHAGLKAVTVCECLGILEDDCYKDRPVTLKTLHSRP